MCKVERKTTRVHGDERLPCVLVVERDPVPDVHERAEREAEHEAEDSQCDATAKELRRQRPGHAAGAPAEHLPWSPRALAEKEVRHEGRERTDCETAASPQRC